MRISFRLLLERSQSRKIFAFLELLFTFIVSAALSVAVSTTKPVDAWILLSTSINIPILVLVVLLMVMFGFGLVIYQWRVDLNYKLTETLRENESLSFYVEELKEKEYLDPITGIPNNFLWEKHLLKIIDKTNMPGSFQAMMIDLVGFRNLNRRFSPSNADKVLRKIAQDLRGGMRRNEQMFRRRREENDVDLRDEFVYRKYRGGDEFYIYIKGDEADAIGFLTRFHRSLRTVISDQISKTILQSSVTLLFYGAVCPIYRGDNDESVAARLDDLINKAKYDKKLRLVWYSSLNPDDVAYDEDDERAHKEAEKEFKCLL